MQIPEEAGETLFRRDTRRVEGSVEKITFYLFCPQHFIPVRPSLDLKLEDQSVRQICPFRVRQLFFGATTLERPKRVLLLPHRYQSLSSFFIAPRLVFFSLTERRERISLSNVQMRFGVLSVRMPESIAE